MSDTLASRRIQHLASERCLVKDDESHETTHIVQGDTWDASAN